MQVSVSYGSRTEVNYSSKKKCPCRKNTEVKTLERESTEVWIAQKQETLYEKQRYLWMKDARKYMEA